MSISSLVAAVGANGQELVLPKVQYSTIFPELVLIVGALMLLLVSSLYKERADQRAYAWYTAVIGLASMVSAYRLWHDLDKGGTHSALAGAIAHDHFSLFFVVVIGSSLVLSALLSGDWLRTHGVHGPELFVLAMLSAAGGMLMGAGNDLIVIFLGLEILSISLYVMAGFNRRQTGSGEAAMKYFILGALSSAIFLYGIALVYGATGTTNLSAIVNFLGTNALVETGLLLGGMALMLVGLAFKVAAAPFHQWTPDVYEGSPSPVVAFMAAAAKAAGFAAMIRVLGSTLFILELDWRPIILTLAVLTLLVGSIVACVQKNVKRMLAYSSISHAGYVLLGVQAATRDGFGGALFYLLAYTFMVIGSFAIVTVVGGPDDTRHDLDSYRGLGRRHPGIALAFTLLLLGQLGMPLTSGFLAKFYVISSLVQNGSYATAVFAMLAAAIAAFFYLRIVVIMFAAAGPGERLGSGSDLSAPEPAAVAAANGAIAVAPAVLPAATWLTLAIAVVVTVGLGVMPQNWIDAIGFARQAASDLVP